MKKLIGILILLVCVSVRAQVTSVTLTITNAAGTMNGQTITVNGQVRTWTNNVVTSASQILTNNTPLGATSNLFAAYVVTPISLGSIRTNATNSVIFNGVPGAAMVVSVSAGWATVSSSTLTGTNTIVMRSPPANVGIVERTNTANGIISYLNDASATDSVAAASVSLSNHMNLTTAQTVSGIKTFTGASIYSNSVQVIYGGTNWAQFFTNVLSLSGSNGLYFNLTNVNPVLTNGQNFGNPFRSPGSGTGSEQFGIGAVANTFGIALGDAAGAGNQGVSVGELATNAGNQNISIGFGAISGTNGGSGEIAIGAQSLTFNGSSSGLGATTVATNGHDTAVGFASTTTASHQIRLGTVSENVSIPGGMQVDGGISNATFAGSITLNNELIVAAFNNTSLATGLNADVNISTNCYVTLATGPGGAFTNVGIAGGVNGRVVTFENTTGQTITWLNDNGLESTAANRLKTGNGDLAQTGNPSCTTWRYSGTLSRWVLVSKN